MVRGDRLIFIRFMTAAWLMALPALALTQSAPPPPQVPVPIAPHPPARVELIFGAARRAPRAIGDLPMRVPPDNPITDAKAALGRRLFFDPQLSADGKVSCATCHEPDRAFADARPLAVGVFGRVGRRHSPALVNRGFGRSHFWDGRAATLELQVLQPIEDPNEMASTIADVVARVQTSKEYAAAFDGVFGDGVTGENLGRALATFIRTIKSVDTPYDRFIAGDRGALSLDAQAGLDVFRRRARCIFCHGEPTFSDEGFHNTGVAWQADAAGVGAFADDGRFAVSKLDRDRGSFKTPTLREVARTAPYMHDGSLQTLADVIDFYDKGGRTNPKLSNLVRPIGLSAEDKRVLIAFLESLSTAPSK